jgi:hypothetical protein
MRRAVTAEEIAASRVALAADRGEREARRARQRAGARRKTEAAPAEA